MTWSVDVVLDDDNIGDDKVETSTVIATFVYGNGDVFTYSNRVDRGSRQDFVQNALRAKEEHDTKRSQQNKASQSILDELISGKKALKVD